jgi:hypothetical protein
MDAFFILANSWLIPDWPEWQLLAMLVVISALEEHQLNEGSKGGLMITKTRPILRCDPKEIAEALSTDLDCRS